MTYKVYSLQNPPRLLRTITGGNFFSASDTDLDGRVEIWTADAAAVDGFESLVVNELDSAPTMVLRFERSRLVDVSSEFRPHYDQEIAKLRAELNSQDLSEFKNSDGKLATTASLSAQQLHRLRGVKIKVIEVAWSYLYSGREQEAWRTLAEMWPDSDVDRIRAAIVNMHAHGIHSQVDGASTGAPAGRKKSAQVFDTIGRSTPNRSEVTPPNQFCCGGPLQSLQSKA